MGDAPRHQHVLVREGDRGSPVELATSPSRVRRAWRPLRTAPRPQRMHGVPPMRSSDPNRKPSTSPSSAATATSGNCSTWRSRCSSNNGRPTAETSWPSSSSSAGLSETESRDSTSIGRPFCPMGRAQDQSTPERSPLLDHEAHDPRLGSGTRSRGAAACRPARSPPPRRAPLWSAGTTFHGAHSVDVAPITSS